MPRIRRACDSVHGRAPVLVHSLITHVQRFASQGPRGRIAKMSAEVVDSNPYSRLMALQRMGIVHDYERIRNKTVRCRAI